jgi:hypothetical protein
MSMFLRELEAAVTVDEDGAFISEIAINGP